MPKVCTVSGRSTGMCIVLLIEKQACGAPHATHIRELVHLTLQQASRGGSALFNATKGPTGVIKSVLDTTRTDGGRRDEIFVDIVEKLTCTFNSSGYLQASQIDGAIVVSSPLLSIRLSHVAC